MAGAGFCRHTRESFKGLRSTGAGAVNPHHGLLRRVTFLARELEDDLRGYDLDS